MTAATVIRFGGYNLMNGGIDKGDDARLQRQTTMLRGLNLDGLCIQEAKKFHKNKWRRLHQLAHDLGMEAYAVRSNHHSCHLAILIRPPVVEFVEELHDRKSPLWHALALIRVRVNGRTVYLGNVHYAPSAPDIRLLEAQACGLIPKRGPSIVIGDQNAAAASEPDPPAGMYPPEKVASKFDRRPAIALERMGLRDMGALLGNTTPTVGHRGSAIPHRGDRIHTNLPREALLSYAVIQEAQPDSNHLAYVGEFAIAAA